MSKIAVVTDSTADIPQHLVEKYDITVISLTINTSEKSYLDRIDISNSEMYELLRDAKQLPITSQPAPSLFLDVYEKLIGDGYDTIISIHISQLLSGTVNSARIAAKQLGDKAKVYVIDSQSATMGLGLLTVLVAQGIIQGTSEEELLVMIDYMVEKMNLYFMLDSLNNLEKGGRIGKASYLVGSILNIKPLLQLREGVISVVKKIRGNKDNRAISELAKTILSEIDPSKKVYIAIGYNDHKVFAEELDNRLREELVNYEIEYYELGSVVSTHIGLGAVGAAYFQ